LAATIGYSFLSFVNNKVAPVAKCRLILLFITIGPVSHNPFGMKTTPPPFFARASIAAVILFVFNVLPSGIAPNFSILEVSLLNFGLMITGSFTC
jgi:hypothetical protein